MIVENCDDSFNEFCEDSTQPTPLENGTKYPDEPREQSKDNLKESDVFQPKTTADLTLSGTPESLPQEEGPSENCDASQPIVSPVLTGLHDGAIVDSKLLQDYANELLEIKSQRHKPLINPLSHVPMDDSALCMSKDKLMEEARIGMENLRSYSDPGVNSVPTADIVFSVLQRDLRCQGLAAGAWDLGWRKGFAWDEVDQIVRDLQKLVISELIEEVLVDSVV